MQTLASFKQTYGIKNNLEFFPHSKGGKVATVRMISNMGNRVTTSIFVAKVFDPSKPAFVVEAEGSDNYILCNSKLDVKNVMSL